MARSDHDKGHWLEGTLTPAKVKEAYEESVRSLRAACWEYEQNLAMIQSQQWLQRHRITNTLVEIPRDGARTRIVADRLLPASRHLLSRLLSRPLVFEVPPNDSDDATVRGAYTAQSVLMDCVREKNWEDLREQSAWATWLGGTGVMALDWDSSSGRALGTTETGRPYGTGDLCATALTVQEVAWEPGTKDAERGTWWIRAQALPPKEVQATYKMKTCPPADASASLTPLGRKAYASATAETAPNLTLVLTVYIRPNQFKPEGAVATLVADQFVDGPKPWSFPFKDRLNMVVVRETKVPGQAHGYTTMSTAVPLQCAYNASMSNLVEHMKLTGNARFMYPEGALDGVDELTDLPGEAFGYAAIGQGGKPEWLTPPQMPQWVIEQPAMIANQMDDILGLHDISRGVAPKNIESGMGLSILVEQDTTPLGAMTRELARGFERLGTMALRIYEAKVKDTRQARVQVPGQIPEIIQWTGKALSGQTQAVVPIDQVMPNSRAATYAMAKE